MHADIPRLSDDLKRVLKSKEAMSILDIWGVGWTDGGCLVLANALQRWLDQGEVLGVWEPVPLIEPDPTGVHYRRLVGTDYIQHHAVLDVNGWLIDGDGITTKQGLIKRWEEDYHLRYRVELRSFDWDTAFEQGIESYRDMESKIMVILDSKFNRTTFAEALQKIA